MRSPLTSVRALAVLVIALWVAPATAQDEEQAFDFALSEAFVHQLADANTILFRLPLVLEQRTRTVHTLADDCELHIAARAPEALAWPPGIVVEPPNLCKNGPPGQPKATSEKQLREVVWPRYLDRNVMHKTCDVVGFPRIFTEHASGNADPANPNHVLEIHPALTLTCGTFQLDLRPFLKAYPGMRRIKDRSAADCIRGRELWLRKHGDRYQFRQEGGGTCGNFAILQATINPTWVRRIAGGHSAIARVSPGGVGAFTLKLYTYDGTAEDGVLEAILQGNELFRRLYLHGMFTYDYFSIVKTLRDRDGTWHEGPDDWTQVRFPLAFVIFGEVSMEEIEE